MKSIPFVLMAASFAADVFAADATKLEVFPTDIHLFNKREGQLVVARVTDPDGVTHDVTAQAKFTFADPKFAKIENKIVRAVADGNTDMRVEFNGQAVTVP